jgi:hypothetical protein
MSAARVCSCSHSSLSDRSEEPGDAQDTEVIVSSTLEESIPARYRPSDLDSLSLDQKQCIEKSSNCVTCLGVIA